MKIAVRYYSRSGNTTKLANAVAQACGVQAEDLSVPLPANVDLLFIGASVYWGGVDKKVKTFITTLNPQMIQHVATFSTAALKKEPDRETEKLVVARHIPTTQASFQSRGSFKGLHKGHPDATDVEQAKQFALAALQEIQ